MKLPYSYLIIRAMALLGTGRGWTRRCRWSMGLTKTAEAGHGGGFDARRRAERHFNLRERFCCRFAAEAVAVDRGHNCLLRLAIADGVVSIDGFR